MITRRANCIAQLCAMVLTMFFGLLGMVSSASAVCGYSPTYCQSQDQYHHSLVLWDGSSYPDFSTANTVYLGTYGSYMAACVDGNFYWIWDDYTDSYPSQLNQDSYLCFGAGNDVVTVLTGSFSCDGVTLGAFAYAGHALQLFGQAGGDTIYGGAGRDDLCGGSGRDNLYGGSGSDRLDGHDNGDRVEAQGDSDYSWGDYYGGGRSSYGGGDRVVDNGYNPGWADVLYGGDGETYYDCVHDQNYDGYVSCGTGSWDYSPNKYQGATDCDLYVGSCATLGNPTGVDQ